MITIALDDLLAEIQERKEALGIVDDEEYTEAMRNKGGERTTEKRELLRRVRDRAVAAGRTPIKAYF